MKRIPFLRKKNIYNWEGTVFNLLCAAYFIFISPIVREASQLNVSEEGAYIPWLGIMLIIVSLLELYAFPKKLKYIHKAAKDHNHPIQSDGILLWLFHAVLSVVILFMIMESFGYTIISSEKTNTAVEGKGWMMLLLFAVVIKELYLLFTMMGMKDETDSLEAYLRPNQKEWIHDLILLAYACIVYTVTWETIAFNTNMNKDNLPMYAVNLFASGLLFLLFYLPLRIPYHLEELAQIKNEKGEWYFIASLIFTVASAVLSL